MVIAAASFLVKAICSFHKEKSEYRSLEVIGQVKGVPLKFSYHTGDVFTCMPLSDVIVQRQCKTRKPRSELCSAVKIITLQLILCFQLTCCI